MDTISIFRAIDKVDGEYSIFAFQHPKGKPVSKYTHYSVITVAHTVGVCSKVDTACDAARLLAKQIEDEGGCYWWNDINETPRIKDMADSRFMFSFEIGTFGGEIVRVLKPGEITVGRRVYTGCTGKKTWRTVSRIDKKSEWRYSIFFEDDFNISAGSECKFLVK